MVVHIQSLADRPEIVKRPRSEVSPAHRRSPVHTVDGPQAAVPPQPVSGFTAVTAGSSLISAQELRQPPTPQEQQIRSRGANPQPGELTESKQAQVQQLQRIDAEVKRHERAHRAAGGPYAGPPSYQYVKGPDGKLYAVSGEVSIDAGPEASPEATIQKLETVIRAANAPANPSAQDKAVAAQARQAIVEAEAKLRAEQREEAERERVSKAELEALTETSADKNGQDSLAIKQGIESYQKVAEVINSLADAERFFVPSFSTSA